MRSSGEDTGFEGINGFLESATVHQGGKPRPRSHNQSLASMKQETKSQNTGHRERQCMQAK